MLRQASFVRHSLAALVGIATNASVWAQDPGKGQSEFLSKCAVCHGVDGKGAGPASGRLKIKPADLTLLAKRNNGEFSADAVARIVDGRNAVKSHGGSAMPIWGCRQSPPPSSQRKATQPKPVDALLDMPCDSEQMIRNRILDVVGYLAQIQEK